MIFSKLISVLNFILSHPIGKKRKLNSLFRYINWQLRSKLFNKLIDIDFVNSLIITPNGSNSCESGTYYVGLVEFEQMSLILHYLRPKDLFYDVGANIGLYTLLSSGVTQAQSVCFEPSSQDFLTLKIILKKII